VVRPHVRGETCQHDSEASGCERVRADVRQEPPKLRLPRVRELEDIVDRVLHLVGFVLLEEPHCPRSGLADGVQRL
jgi:hypothetical protein